MEIFENLNFFIWLLTSIIVFIAGQKVGKFKVDKANMVKEKDTGCNGTCKYILKKDLIYICIIAYIIMLVFATKTLYDNDTFGAQLSFAGTVSSIILSVLAIIMTIFGESKQESTKNSIDKAAKTIEQNADILQKYVKEIQEINISSLTKSIEEVNSQLKETASEVKKQGKDISQLMNRKDSTYVPGNPQDYKQNGWYAEEAVWKEEDCIAAIREE